MQIGTDLAVPDPDLFKEYGSRSRKAKLAPKNKSKYEISVYKEH